MANTLKVHGHEVSYDQDAYHGVHYLNTISFNEAEVFFRQAKVHGSAEFEDTLRRHFTLEYHDGVYTLVH